MNWLVFSLIIILSACTGNNGSEPSNSKTKAVQPPLISTDSQSTKRESKSYANARFKNVVIEKLKEDTYEVTGEGQIFEASFSWVIEDGHNELQSGYSTTDAGAPAWGKFNFTVTAAKARANSFLHIILFEISAEDGRRTHELPILLK